MGRDTGVCLRARRGEILDDTSARREADGTIHGRGRPQRIHDDFAADRSADARPHQAAGPVAVFELSKHVETVDERETRTRASRAGEQVNIEARSQKSGVGNWKLNSEFAAQVSRTRLCILNSSSPAFTLI